MALWLLIGIPLFLLAFAGFVFMIFKLAVIVLKAMEKPEQGENTDFSLEQGREPDQ